MERLDDIKKQRIINHAIELGLAGRKKNVTWPRNLAVAAASIIIGISVIGYTFPALAQHIPIIGGIFARIEEMSNLSDYAIIIDEMQTVDGVSFTLNEALFDGRNILLTYLVESEQALRQKELDTQAFYHHWDAYHFDISFGLIVDGVEVPTGLSAIYFGNPTFHWIDDYRFFFVFHLPLLRGVSPRLSGILENAEKIEVFTNFSDLSVTYPDEASLPAEWDTLWLTDLLAKGPWEFNVSLEQSERMNVYVGQRFYQYDFDARDIDAWRYSLSGSVTSISVTPTTLSIDYFQNAAIHQLMISEGENEIMRESWQSNEWVTTITGVEWHVTTHEGVTLTEISRREEANTGDFSRGRIDFDMSDISTSYIFITPTISQWQANIRWSSETQSDVVYKGAFLDRIELEAIIVELP